MKEKNNKSVAPNGDGFTANNSDQPMGCDQCVEQAASEPAS
jgi:hypothetical protein